MATAELFVGLRNLRIILLNTRLMGKPQPAENKESVGAPHLNPCDLGGIGTPHRIIFLVDYIIWTGDWNDMIGPGNRSLIVEHPGRSAKVSIFQFFGYVGQLKATGRKRTSWLKRCLLDFCQLIWHYNPPDSIQSHPNTLQTPSRHPPDTPQTPQNLVLFGCGRSLGEKAIA